MSKEKDKAMKETEFTKLKQFLKDAGLTTQEIKDSIGDKAEGRTPEAISELIKEFLRQVPDEA